MALKGNWPLPEEAERVAHKGHDCVILAPDDYEALFDYAISLEQKISDMLDQAETYSKAIIDRDRSLELERNRNDVMENIISELTTALRWLADDCEDMYRARRPSQEAMESARSAIGKAVKLDTFD